MTAMSIWFARIFLVVLLVFLFMSVAHALNDMERQYLNMQYDLNSQIQNTHKEKEHNREMMKLSRNSREAAGISKKNDDLNDKIRDLEFKKDSLKLDILKTYKGKMPKELQAEWNQGEELHRLRLPVKP